MYLLAPVRLPKNMCTPQRFFFGHPLDVPYSYVAFRYMTVSEWAATVFIN